MKNSTNRIVQIVKWSCALALILLGVSLPLTSLAQPMFNDTGFTSNTPPTPGPNDIYQTNCQNVFQESGGINFATDNGTGTNGLAPGVTFVTPSGGTRYAVTNVMIETSVFSGDYGNTGGGNGTPLNDNQSYVISFYQIAGATAANGVSSNVTLITSIISSNGLVKSAGDWMSFSNFAVFLNPGTTNAFSIGRLTSQGSGVKAFFQGEGWMHLPLVTNHIGAGPATHYFGTGTGLTSSNGFYNGMVCVITNSTGVNYSVPNTAAGGTYWTNCSTIFDIGINTSFLPATFLAQPYSVQIAAPFAGTANATLIATAVGSSNTLYGIGGYWMLVNGANPSGLILATTSVYQANGPTLNSTNVSITITPNPVGAPGATISSTLTVSNYTANDVGSYVFVVTNSPDGVTTLTNTSAAATISFVNVPPNSFASAVVSNGWGAFAYYPLNETVDPSTGVAEAFELLGGANGIYGPAAVNGAGNALEHLYAGTGSNGWAAVPGPATVGLTGLPSQGAFGTYNNTFNNDYIVVPSGPTNWGQAANTPNSTNVTFVAWIYDATNTENTQAGIVTYRNSLTSLGGIGLCSGQNAANNTLGYEWDANAAATWNYNSAVKFYSNGWNMAALVITPSNSTIYLCTTNSNRGIQSAVQTVVNPFTPQAFANQWQPLGGRMGIGIEENGMNGSSVSHWQGYISSIAMFTNSLSTMQIESLFASGYGGGAPVIVANAPESSLPVLTNTNSLVLSPVVGYGGTGSLAWWQMSNAATAPNWVKVTSANLDFMNATPINNGGAWVSAIQATNFQPADAGAYEMVISNSLGYATSSVVNLFVSGGFIAQLTANPAAYGLYSLYPLNETNDPSTGTAAGMPGVLAYDIYGGYNGTYGTNSRDGGPNTGAALPAVAGPGTQGFPGLPTQGALGVTNDSGHGQSYVGITNTPNLPMGPGSTNVSMVIWIYPTVASESGQTGLVFMGNGPSETPIGFDYSQSSGVNNHLGYTWNGNQNWGYDSLLAPAQGTWNLAAMVISPTGTEFYLANTNVGLQMATNNNNAPLNNRYMPWGNAGSASFAIATIGADLRSLGKNFEGYMSSFALCTNALTASQIGSLFLSGWGGGLQPMILTNINLASQNILLVPGAASSNSITATAFGGTGTGGYWQVNTGSGWGPITSPDFWPGVTTTVAAGLNQVGALNILNFQAGDAGSYQLVFTNAYGGATSSVVTLSLAPAPAAGSFEAQAVNAANGMGLMAFWPLNETGDPSGGLTGHPVVAYDIYGAYNGYYGTNSRDGGVNSAYSLPAVVGPGLQGLAGLPTQGALGVTNSTLMLDSYVAMSLPPTVPPGSTNVTIAAWIYPTTNEAAYTGLVFERNVAVNGLCYGGIANNELGYTWDNNSATTYGYNSFLIVPTNMWSMVAMVITPTNSTFYVGNTNTGIGSATQTINNTYQAWGNSVMDIGTDSSTIPGRNFVGYMSSVAFFSNALSVSQIELLFNAGVGDVTTIPPIISSNVPFQFRTNYLVAGGYSSSIVASAYLGTNNAGGVWQVQTAPNVWSAITSPDFTTLTAVSNGSLYIGTLTVTNFTAANDAGSYRLVVSNTMGYATSTVVTLAPATPAAGSFTALAVSYGATAFWPLNETADPSTGLAVAYDLVGGFNGIYGINAQDGGSNTVDAFAPALGPTAPALAGFPAAPNGALGVLLNSNATFVTTTRTPTFPTGPGTTNATLLAWIYPNVVSEANYTAIFMTHAGFLGSTNTAGIQYYNNSLGYQWDNDATIESNYASGLVIPSNMWSMVALVITPSNNYFYVASTNYGLVSAVQIMTNSTGGQPTNFFLGWGGGADIGTDPGNAPGRNFGGLISSVAMFSNALSIAQIATLYDTGLATNSQLPFFTQNPGSYEVIAGARVNMSAIADPGNTLPAGGYWQVNYGSGWNTIPYTGGTGSPVSTDITNATVPTNFFLANQTNSQSSWGTYTNIGTIYTTLYIPVSSAADIGSYQLVVSNGTGSVTSAVATITIFTPNPGSFSAALIAPAYGAVAYWPLNETNDPSLGGAIAFDIIGQFNGIYGTNAQNAGTNTGLLSRTPQYYLPPKSPASVGFTGFNGSGSLGSVRNSLHQTYVTTAGSPLLLPNTANSTNATMIAWVYPNVNMELAYTGVFMERTNNTGLANGIQYGTADQLGYHWDNDSQTAWSYNSGPIIPSNTWSMLTVVITPYTNYFYVANNQQGLTVAAQVMTNGSGGSTNIYQAMGLSATIGGDPGGAEPARNFGGYIRSVAIFTNSLTASNIEVLFNAGVGSGAQAPIFTLNPESYRVLPGYSPTVSFAASTYLGIPTNANSGSWQVNKGSGWVNLVNDGSHVAGAVPTNVNNYTNLLYSTLWLTNITSADVGSYQLVVTNGAGISATSLVATITIIEAAHPGSFRAVAAADGAVAFWPLDEAVDPSGAITNNPAVAYDIIGGFNGTYGINAANGASNVLDGFAAVPGPNSGPSPLTGLPTTGALGSLQNGLANTFVSTLASPVVPANTTNLTIVAWVYPQIFEANYTGLVIERTASQLDGLSYGPNPNNVVPGQLGYAWSGNTNYSGAPLIPDNVWSMVAMVVTPTNTSLYVANVDGMTPVTQVTSNAYQSWGGPLSLGGDPGAGASPSARSFGGYISSVAIFTNALPVASVQNLFLAGFSLGTIPPPIIVQNPPSAVQVYNGANVTLNAIGYGQAPAGGYWQYSSTPGVWVTPSNPDIAGGVNTIQGAVLQVGALQITNVSAADAGSYQLVITNGNTAGPAGANIAATSTVVMLSVVAAPAAGSYAAAVLNPNLGAVALWPLNEASDPSLSPVVAHDYVGGHNGLYGTNAVNGVGNSADSLPAAPSPYSAGLIGLPSGGALGSLQNWKPFTYVYLSNAPTFEGLNGPLATAINNSTNVTIVAWVNPQTNEAGATGLVMARNGAFGSTRTDGLATYFGNSNVDLGYNWDNNNATTWSYNSGLLVGRSNWSMVALVITPSNSILYVGNSNFVTSATQWMTNGAGGSTNDNEPFGSGLTIGGDPALGAIANSFGGYMSSVAMFSNSLSLQQIESLWVAGESNGAVQAPYIVQQPASTNVVLVAPGGIGSISANGFAALPAIGYWQVNNGSTWVQVSSADVSAPSIMTTVGGASGTLEVGVLQFTNFQAGDAGSYELVISNAGGWATSSVVVINPYSVTPGSYASLADSAGYSAVALWPLNEIVDPSTGISGSPAVAFDVIGGFNGTYGTNADNGIGNAAYGFAPVVGPGSQGLAGLPTAGALGVTNNPTYSNSYVNVAVSPTFPSTATNVTIAGWFYPRQTAAQTYEAGLFMTPNGGPGVAGIQYVGNGVNLGYHWDNNAASTYNYSGGPAIAPLMWNMLAVVVTPSNSLFYVGNSNNAGNWTMVSSTQWMTNASGSTNMYESWGNSIQIGSDITYTALRNVNGYMSSFAMFAQSLSVAQIQALFSAGVANGNLPPSIISNPATTNLELTLDASASFSATAYGGSNAVAYWQVNTGSGWATVSSPDAAGVNATLVNAQLVGTLTITNFTPLVDAGSYALVVSNNAGWVTSTVVAIKAFSPAVGTFAYVAATNKALGLLSLWPLNETIDPSTATAGAAPNVVAYDVFGGFNGFYQTNANNGGGNAGAGFAAVSGPGNAGLVGLPNTGALGVTNDTAHQYSYVTVTTPPTLPANSTNASIVAWVYPTASEGTYSAMVFERNGSTADGMGYGGTANILGYTWDNNNGATWGYNSTLNVPLNMWSMAAVVIGPTNTTFYVANTNSGLMMNVQANTNIYQAWGNVTQNIGADPVGGLPGNNFKGYISSAAIFSNTLTLPQIESLFSAGLGDSTNAPYITVQPASNMFLLPGLSPTITSAGYAGVNGGGYWATNNGSAWVPASVPGHLLGTNATAATNGGNWIGSLSISNVQSSDAGTYAFILTNNQGPGGSLLYATSSPVTIQVYQTVAGSYASALANTNLGCVAFWPLSETNDPSTGTAVAYDVVGGFNGLYLTNAQSGGTNSWIAANLVANLLTNNGPLFAGYAGMPNASLGSFQAVAALPSTYVFVPTGPAFPPGTANSSNVSILCWVYRTVAETGWTGLVRDPNSDNTDSLSWAVNGGGQGPGIVWDNVGINNGSSLTVATGLWSLVGVSISSSNYVYVTANKATGLSFQTNTRTTARNQAWGKNINIGSDPYDATPPGRNWGGNISSVAMFSNVLTPLQIQTLYYSALNNGSQVPQITIQPVSTNIELLQGINATLTSTGFAGTNSAVGWWQTNTTGGGWGKVSFAGTSNLLTSNVSQQLVASTLFLTNFNASDVGQYEFVLSNTAGLATSLVATLSVYATVPGSFAAQLTNSLYGCMAFYPLNETTDPSIATAGAAPNVVAYDVVGGYNGIYQTNADNGGGNAGAGFTASPAPYASGLIGLPTQGSLGVTNDTNHEFSYVSVAIPPTMPVGTTNISLLAWVYPTSALESSPGSAGIVWERAGPTYQNGNGMGFGNTVNTLGYDWDNNNATCYNFVSGITIPINTWSMVALAISPTNSSFFMANTNGVQTAVQTLANIYIPWGNTTMYLGSDSFNFPIANMQGYISSAAVFSNTLTTVQLISLYYAGANNGPPPATISLSPSSIEVLAGFNATLNAAGYVGATGTGWWQITNINGTITRVLPINAVSVLTTNANTLTVSGALTFTGLQTVLDANQYEFVVSNSIGNSTSTVATVTVYAAPLGSFASQLTNTALGVVGFWPLDETGDPSLATVTAHDIIGAFNGTYGTNANTGGGNSVGGLSANPGPGTQGLTGLPVNGALGDNNLTAQPAAYVNIPISPTFSTNGPNTTNVSIVGWIYPNPANGQVSTNQEAVEAGLFMERGTYVAGLKYGGSGSNTIAVHWDNDPQALWGAGWLSIPDLTWSMVAATVSPSNITFYVANTTQGVTTYTQTYGNENVPFGQVMRIGSDSGTVPGRNFVGSMSSFAMFSNTLTLAQIETLYDAGLASGTNAPTIVTQPPFTTNFINTYITNDCYNLVTNGGATITVTAYTGPTGGAYWQFNGGSGWVNVNFGNATTVNSNSLNLTSSLVLSDVGGTNAGLYQCVVTNGGVSVTSQVVSVSLISDPPANSFAAVAIGYGAVAYWPLNDQTDPASGGASVPPVAPAYDIVGGWNGFYGKYSVNGVIQSGLLVNGVQGPQPPQFTGFPVGNGALGTTNNLTQDQVNFTLSAGIVGNAQVLTAGSPTIPANTTNMTMLAWVYPTVYLEPPSAGIVTSAATPTAGAEALGYGGIYGNNANDIYFAYLWNGGNGGVATFEDPPSNTWSMLAWITTSTNTSLYICNTNVGVAAPYVQYISNAYQSWGGPLAIGGYPNNASAVSNFNGYISSVAIFTNALSADQIAILYYAGLVQDVTPPVISSQPVSTAVYDNRTATFTVAATGITNIAYPTLGYQWQVNTGSGWVNVINGNGVSGATTATLVISSPPLSLSGASYQVIVSDQFGATPSTAVTLISADSTGLCGYAVAITNLNPVAYYELNETSGTIAYDFWGGLSGLYGSGVSLYAEYGPDQIDNGAEFVNDSGGWPFTTSSPIFTNAFVETNLTSDQSNACVTTSFVTIPAMNINSNAMTAILWIYPNELQTHVVGLLYCRSGGTVAGFGFNGNGAGDLGYNWADVAGSYGYVTPFAPIVSNWNMIAYVVSPSNTSIYCYNTNAQNVGVNAVTNRVEAWNANAFIGTDPYDLTGLRQFDGAISEVAIFNQALTGDQINNLFYIASGIALPARLTSSPATSTNQFMVNEGGTGVFTATAVNGPLGFDWRGPGVDMPTNGNYTFAQYPGQVFNVNTVGYTSTLTITNMQAGLSGQQFEVAVTNALYPSAQSVGIALFTMPSLFPTTALWTTDFSITNGASWYGASTAGYKGHGVISAGTNWNAINGAQFAIGAVALYTNNSSLDDTGNINTGVSLAITNGAGWQCSGGGALSPVLDYFMRLGTYNGATGTNIYITTMPGYYNLFVYSLNGTCGARGTIFKINSTTQTSDNGTNLADTSFVLITNYVIFTNVFASNGFINMSAAANPNASLGGNTANEIDFNGLQLQLINPYMPLSLGMSNSSPVVTYAGCNLLSAPTVNGPWTPVVGARGATNIGTNTYVLPSLTIPNNAPSAAIFYQTESASPMPGLPTE